MGGRDTNVDSLRGIACILLVTLHVSHSQWGAAGWLEWYADTFTYIRMPLFAFLAGLVYAWRPLTDRALYGQFLSKKVRRLLVPYAIFVPAVGLAGILMGSPPEAGPLHWLLYSIAPYWFLLASFWVFAVVALLDAFHLIETPARVGILIGALLLVNVTVDLEGSSHLLQLAQACYLGLFFVAGLAATRFDWRRTGLRGGIVMAIATLVLFAYTQVPVNGIWSYTSQRMDILGIALGVAFPLAFLALGLSSRFLAWVGGYSSGIFLLHPFAILASRFVLDKAGVDALIPSLLVTAALGIFGSILGVVLLRTFMAGRVALGEKARAPRETVAA
ncbi:acyltransferase family protein [Demequina gelatinilytica]|uniref:acyltransferase family protein n=1 Tax=Demequina gelatinilytica TaxID=1638980 RepID=UPI000AA71794|nr:acyltransferase [Demequina gelatinilytica]